VKMSKSDARAVFAAIKRHLPHIAARVEAHARLVEEMGFPVTPETLRRSDAFASALEEALSKRRGN